MTGIAPEDRGDLAEDMLTVAARLAVLVHGEGGAADIEALIGGLGGQEMTALVVALAGVADPDRPLTELLGWLDFDEHGRQTSSSSCGWDDTMTLRDLADTDAGDPEVPEDFVDENAVAAYLAGRRVNVTPREKLLAIERGMRLRGMTIHDFDILHGLSRGRTTKFLTQQREAFAKRGEAFPELFNSAAPRVFSVEEIVQIRRKSAAGMSDLEISMSYGVRRQVISHITSGRTRPDAPGPVRAQRTAPSSAQREFAEKRSLANAG